MRTLNLVRDPWIPVVTKDGERLRIAPPEIGRNDVARLAWPRADLGLAQLEFLIGLLTTACPPETEEQWGKWWEAPPSPEELATRFLPFEQAFEFNGPHARFLQDLEQLDGENLTVAGLLIEQPGANTVKNNTDLFIRRSGVPVLGLTTAAIVLYALQTFAPSGGAGHRTSLRGGGPLCTLAVSEGEDNLWRRLWLNVVLLRGQQQHKLSQNNLADAFPWLAATRVSDKAGVATAPANVHPAQCFWGMPRRIRLEFVANTDGAPCAITGETEDIVVSSYRTRPYGVNYHAAGGWHPLTPHYRMKKDAELLPVHGQPGGTAYRHWPGLVLETENLRVPALAITQAKERLAFAGEKLPRLHLAGYDMDNMKARGFLEAEMPLLLENDAEFLIQVEQFASAATEAARMTATAVRNAWGTEDGTPHELIRAQFFSATERSFFEKLSARGTAESWLGVLKREGYAIFEREVPAVGAFVDLDLIKRIARARHYLLLDFAGFSAAGKRLHSALGLAPPKARAKQKAGTP